MTRPWRSAISWILLAVSAILEKGTAMSSASDVEARRSSYFDSEGKSLERAAKIRARSFSS